MRGSNYETTKKESQKLFLKYDQQRMIDKFHLEHDDDFLYIEFVARRYRIDRHSGNVEWKEICAEHPAYQSEKDSGAHLFPDTSAETAKSSGNISKCLWHEAGFEEVLSIFDVLCYSKDGCRLSGNYCGISNVKGANLAAAPGNDMFASAARSFDHHTAQLAAACEALGGTKAEVGDVSYLLPVFPFLSIRLQFWESDDEFPPQLKFMWDENILQFMHFETTFYVTGHVIDRLLSL